MKHAQLTTLASTVLASTAFAQLPPPTPGTTEWRFTGDTGVFVDKVAGPGTLEYADGDGGMTDQLDLFTTTSTASIPDIGGIDAPVMFFDLHTPSMGYEIRTLTGAANNDNWRFTLVFDLYVDANNMDGWLALWQGNAINANDAELFLRPVTESLYQAGSGTVAAGSWSRGQWLRIVNVVDFPDATGNPTSADTGDIYIDGVLAFSGVAPDWFYDGQTNPCWILADENNETSQGYIANLAFTDALLTPGEVVTLGGPKANGVFDFNAPLGVNYCGPAIPNSTNFPATISANGSLNVAANDVTLSAAGLPPGQFGYFLAGQTQGFFNPPGSQGLICLVGNIGRYNQIANIIQGPMGSIQIDLTAIPVNPPAAAQAGETWNFQCWYRDLNPTLTNNFTDGLEITFQ
ncbi:MAG: hypothetical protein GY711_02280 [bacterium]|nr:hypothetical protein [bacterium]